jgi:hypothetical protein
VNDPHCTVKAVSTSTIIDVLKHEATNTWTKAQLTTGSVLFRSSAD